MSRLADYFVIVGYDHEKERKCPVHENTAREKRTF